MRLALGALLDAVDFPPLFAVVSRSGHEPLRLFYFWGVRRI
jgi:hypothetical protein